MGQAERAQSGERTSSPGQHPMATTRKRAPPICGVLILVLGNQTK
jgi:hypothetical protein